MTFYTGVWITSMNWGHYKYELMSLKVWNEVITSLKRGCYECEERLLRVWREVVTSVKLYHHSLCMWCNASIRMVKYWRHVSRSFTSIMSFCLSIAFRFYACLTSSYGCTRRGIQSKDEICRCLWALTLCSDVYLCERWRCAETYMCLGVDANVTHRTMPRTCTFLQYKVNTSGSIYVPCTNSVLSFYWVTTTASYLSH